VAAMSRLRSTFCPIYGGCTAARKHQGKVPLRFRVKLQHLRAINNLQQELEKIY